MADKVVEPVEFDQQKISVLDPLLEATLGGIGQFSKNLSGLVENLVNFFTIIIPVSLLNCFCI